MFIFFRLYTYIITNETDTRYKEHLHSFRNNNTQSIFAQHILANDHAFGKADDVMNIKYSA
jgi:hypothetical protein